MGNVLQFPGIVSHFIDLTQILPLVGLTSRRQRGQSIIVVVVAVTAAVASAVHARFRGASRAGRQRVVVGFDVFRKVRFWSSHR